MEVKVSSPKAWLREFEVEIEPEKLTGRAGELLEEYRGRAEVPGFRRGRVPKAVFERRMGSAVESAAVEELVEQVLPELLQEHKVRPASQGKLEALEVLPSKAIRLRYAVEVIPDFELKPYTGLKLKKEEPTGFDAEFDRRVQALRERCATFKPVPREAASGDFVTVDYRMLDGEREVAKPKSNVMVGVGSDENVKEVNEALLGSRPGQERRAVVTYPADYPQKEVAGKAVAYVFQVRDVKERVLPELSEELAQDLGYDNLDALRQAINDEILADRSRLVENGLKNQVFEQLVREHDFEPPQTWVAASLDRLQRQYELPEDEATRTKLMPAAQKWAKYDCLVTLIAEKEHIHVTDDEIAGQIERLAAELKRTPEEVAPLLDNPSYRNQALRDKVMKFLLEKAEKE